MIPKVEFLLKHSSPKKSEMKSDHKIQSNVLNSQKTIESIDGPGAILQS